VTLNSFLFQALNGLASAAGLFFIAAGLSLIFGVTRVINIAHGSLYMLGTYIAYSFATKIGGVVGFWGGIVATALLIGLFGNIPVLSSLFAGPPYGIGVLTSALILAIMVLPFITSISRDVFEAVPPVLKEAAYGIGCTTWEVFRKVVLPYTRVGVIGGVMLGLGRALGETMAVTFVIGNAHKVSASLLAPGTTISATIANEFTEAVGDLYTSSLIALGLILFVITFIVLTIARLLLARIEKRIG